MLDQEHFRKSMDAQKRLEAELRSVREQMSRELSSDVYVASQVDTAAPFGHDRKLSAHTAVVPVVRSTYERI